VIRTNVREGKGREVNLGNSEERVRDPRKEMTIRFVLLVNKQGQTRLAQYYEYLTIDERRALEGEIVRKCLARSENQCSFVEHRNYKIIYRRYASLFFLVGVDGEENELAILEFIHCVVETMDRYFGNVCELDIMFHLEKAHFMLEEMVMNGCIVETNKVNILAPIQLMDKSS
jgi:AP-4 complex subunit sigma-1